MKVFRAFAVASALLAFAIAILGSWVRINGAGLTCPDWPLCHGALVPSLRGGVVLEWSHRFVAFVEGFVILGAIVSGLRVRARVAGVTPALAVLGIIFALQVSLGGITVFLSNSPLSVMLHWAMGMALLAILTVLAVLSILAPHRHGAGITRERFEATATTVYGIAALLAFATMCIGAYVSSSNAGLACTTVPACDGSTFGRGAAQHAQMMHRLLAGSFALAAAFAALAARDATRAVRAFTFAGAGLVVAQIALGVANVVWQLPIVLREAHAANAGATFIAFVIATVLAALEPSVAHATVPHHADAPAQPAARRVARTT